MVAKGDSLCPTEAKPGQWVGNCYVIMPLRPATLGESLGNRHTFYANLHSALYL